MIIQVLYCEDIEYLFEPDEKCQTIKVEKVCIVLWNSLSISVGKVAFIYLSFLEFLEKYRQRCCCASLCTCKEIVWGNYRKQPTLLDIRRDYTRSVFDLFPCLVTSVWYFRSVQTQRTDSLGRRSGHLYDRGGHISAEKSQQSFGRQRIGAGQIQFLCMETLW